MAKLQAFFIATLVMIVAATAVIVTNERPGLMRHEQDAEAAAEGTGAALVERPAAKKEAAKAKRQAKRLEKTAKKTATKDKRLARIAARKAKKAWNETCDENSDKNCCFTEWGVTLAEKQGYKYIVAGSCAAGIKDAVGLTEYKKHIPGSEYGGLRVCLRGGCEQEANVPDSKQCSDYTCPAGYDPREDAAGVCTTAAICNHNCCEINLKTTSRHRQNELLSMMALFALQNVSKINNDLSIDKTTKGDAHAVIGRLLDGVSGLNHVLQRMHPAQFDTHCSYTDWSAIEGCVHEALCVMEANIDHQRTHTDKAITEKELKRYTLVMEYYGKFNDVSWEALKDRMDDASPRTRESAVTAGEIACGGDTQFLNDLIGRDSLVQFQSEDLEATSAQAAAHAASQALLDATHRTHSIMDAHMANSSADATIGALHAAWEVPCKLLACDHTNYWDLLGASHDHSLALIALGASAHHMKVHIRSRSRLDFRMMKFLTEFDEASAERFYRTLGTNTEAKMEKWMDACLGEVKESAIEHATRDGLSSHLLALFDRKAVLSSMGAEHRETLEGLWNKNLMLVSTEEEKHVIMSKMGETSQADMSVGEVERSIARKSGALAFFNSVKGWAVAAAKWIKGAVKAFCDFIAALFSCFGLGFVTKVGFARKWNPWDPKPWLTPFGCSNTGVQKVCMFGVAITIAAGIADPIYVIYDTNGDEAGAKLTNGDEYGLDVSAVFGIVGPGCDPEKGCNDGIIPYLRIGLGIGMGLRWTVGGEFWFKISVGLVASLSRGCKSHYCLVRCLGQTTLGFKFNCARSWGIALKLICCKVNLGTGEATCGNGGGGGGDGLSEDQKKANAKMQQFIKDGGDAGCRETLEGAGYTYRGCQTYTKSGRMCQRWTSPEPHKVNIGVQTGLLHKWDHNQCRNPGTDNRFTTIWCYTTDRNLEKEECFPVSECQVTLYGETDFSGWEVTFQRGRYKVAEFTNMGAMDNEAKSMVVQGRYCSPQLFEHGTLDENYGQNQQFGPYADGFGRRQLESWNIFAKKVSSMIVHYDPPSCDAAETLNATELNPFAECFPPFNPQVKGKDCLHGSCPWGNHAFDKFKDAWEACASLEREGCVMVMGIHGLYYLRRDIDPEQKMQGDGRQAAFDATNAMYFRKCEAWNQGNMQKWGEGPFVMGPINTNACPNGYIKIQDAARCHQSGSLLRKSVGTWNGGQTSSSAEPSGCFLNRQGLIYFNTDASGGSDAECKPICEKASAHQEECRDFSGTWLQEGSTVDVVITSTDCEGLASQYQGNTLTGSWEFKVSGNTFTTIGQAWHLTGQISEDGGTIQLSNGHTMHKQECTWTAHANSYSLGYAGGDDTHYSLEGAKAECAKKGPDVCKAITCHNSGHCTLRAGAQVEGGSTTETTYTASSLRACEAQATLDCTTHECTRKVGNIVCVADSSSIEPVYRSKLERSIECGDTDKKWMQQFRFSASRVPQAHFNTEYNVCEANNPYRSRLTAGSDCAGAEWTKKFSFYASNTWYHGSTPYHVCESGNPQRYLVTHNLECDNVDGWTGSFTFYLGVATLQAESKDEKTKRSDGAFTLYSRKVCSNSRAQCRAWARSEGLTLADGNHGSERPAGCFADTHLPGYAFYNDDAEGGNYGWPYYQVCGTTEGSYGLTDKGTNGCPYLNAEVVTEDGCKAAAKALGMAYRQAFGAADQPRGCMHYEGEVWFNLDATGAGNGLSTPICKASASYGLSSEGSNGLHHNRGELCSTPDTEGECKLAALSIGLQYSASFHDATNTKGCLVYSDDTVWFNTHATGAGNAASTPVCRGPDDVRVRGSYFITCTGLPVADDVNGQGTVYTFFEDGRVLLDSSFGLWDGRATFQLRTDVTADFGYTDYNYEILGDGNDHQRQLMKYDAKNKVLEMMHFWNTTHQGTCKSKVGQALLETKSELYRGCPSAELGGCLNGNTAYSTFQDAWSACPTVPGCNAILKNPPDNKYYLRRLSDPMGSGRDVTPYTECRGTGCSNGQASPDVMCKWLCEHGIRRNWCMRHEIVNGQCNLYKCDLPFDEAKACPASHPYPYHENNGWCCKTNKETVYAPSGKACDGSPFNAGGIQSMCCESTAIPCPAPPCSGRPGLLSYWGRR